MRVRACVTVVCIISLLFSSACGTPADTAGSAMLLPTTPAYPMLMNIPTAAPPIVPTARPAALQASYPDPASYPSPTPIYNPAGPTASQIITATLTPLKQVLPWAAYQHYPPPWPNAGFQFFNANDGLGAGQVENQRALLETHDGGRSWQFLGPLPLECTSGGMQFLTPTDGWVWGHPLYAPHAAATLCHTQDGGKTWTSLLLQQLPAYYQTISVVDAQTIYVSGPQQPLLVSHDGGVTLTVVSPEEINNIQTQFVSQRQGWAINDARLVFTANGGQTWQAVSLGYQVYNFYALSDQQVWVYGGDCDGHYCKPLLVRTQDGGRTWVRYEIETPSSLNYLGVLQVFRFIDSQHGWLYFGSNELWSTSDGRLTWQQLQ